MRFLRPLVAALAFAGAALVAPFALAAATVTVGSPVWSGRPSTSLELNEINRADCLAADAKITFDVGLTGDTSGYVFQVWAGTTCTAKTSRDSNEDCNMVFESDPDAETDVTVSVRDILQEAAPGRGAGTGTEETCTPSGGTTGGITHSLFFLVINQSKPDEAPGAGQWDFTYDLVPPAPPTDVVAGPAENALTLKFAESEDDDLKGYRFYCSDAVTQDAEGTCTSTVLVEGNSPLGLKSCGSTNSKISTSGETDDSLVNGTNYAVAVAAEDNLGNLGVLSAVACGVPQEVTGYFEAYRAAGGEAGGGFCSFAPARRGALPLAAALAIGLVAFARRRK
jgi:hypothetical protein